MNLQKVVPAAICTRLSCMISYKVHSDRGYKSSKSVFAVLSGTPFCLLLLAAGNKRLYYLGE